VTLPIGCYKTDASHRQVADASPIPVIIYSYPAVSSGIVMDTDLVRRLAKHPNIVGIKHTDHEVGRIAREASIKSYGCKCQSLPET
jgi:4-hydroxy-2-oxoglutarate aldolase